MGLIAGGLAIGALATDISSQVMKRDLEDLVNSHKEELEIIKRITTNLQKFEKNKDMIPIKLINEVIPQMSSDIASHIYNLRENLAYLIKKHPQNHQSRLAPGNELCKTLLVSFKQSQQTENLNYFLTQQFHKKNLPSFKAFFDLAVPIRWNKFGGSEDTFDKYPISAQNAVVAGIQLAMMALHLYEIINNIKQMKKLAERKEQIKKQIEQLPQAQYKLVQKIREGIISFLFKLMLAGQLIIKIRNIFQFVSAFRQKKQWQALNPFLRVLNEYPSPFQLMPWATIRTIYSYVLKFQEILKHMDQQNAAHKIKEANFIFEDYLKQVKIIQLENMIKSTFIAAEKNIQMAKEELKVLKILKNYMDDLIRILDQNNQSDDISGPALIKKYQQLFSKNSLQSFDKQIILTYVAAFRQKFYADDQSGLTFLGLEIPRYLSSYIKNNSKTPFAIINETDVTYYEQDWVNQFYERIFKQICNKYPNEKNIQYYRSTLKYHGDGSIDQHLKATKSIFFKGESDLYRVDCDIDHPQQFKIFIHTGEDRNKVKIIQKSVLKAGGKLLIGQYLKSKNRQYQAVMYSNGNLVVYKGEKWSRETIVWSSQTNREKSQYTLFLQQTGNLIISVSKYWGVVWTTNTIGNSSPNYKLCLLDNGRLVIYNQGNQEVWSSIPQGKL